jgi:EmrB/QacA subfamily drug resistance transporter
MTSIVLAATAPTTRWWALAVVVAAQFMFVVDAFVVNVALPSIRTELGAGEGEIAAVVAIYQLAYATMVITGGRLGDILGRRKTFVAGVIAFTLASLWCGLAGSASGLVLARLAQGAAAALMVPQVLATIHALFQDGARARAFAIFGVALGLGGAAGFLLGGWLLAVNPAGLGWRSVFLVNLPVGAVIAFAGWRLLPVGAARPGMRLDLPGAALLFLALLCLVGPLLAGPQLGWPWWLLALAAAGMLLVPALMALERAVERRGGLPLLDLALLTDRAYCRGLAAVFTFQLANIPFYLVMTLLLQDRLGYAPEQAASMAAPLAIAFSLAAQLSGRLMARHGLRVLLGGCLLQVTSLLILAGLAWDWPQPAALPLMAALVLFGFGQGLVMAPLSGLVLGTVRAAQAGAAAGVLNTVHQAGGALGVSLLGVVYFTAGPVVAFLALVLALLATFALLCWRQAVVMS